MWAQLRPLGRSPRSGGYFRQPFTQVDAELRAWFREECNRRELELQEDPFGNLAAWWVPSSNADLSKGILTGSHLDSVLDGGAFDGPLGVVSALAAIDLLRERGFVPTRPIGVGVFVEEEGSRFGVACLGSRLAAGQMSWDQAKELRDPTGIWLADAYAVAEIDPKRAKFHLPAFFLELHIEQGRDLVHRDQAIGVASKIWPHGRYRFEFIGQANHAGTTKMSDRHDPMLTYSVTALAAAKIARQRHERATFGRIEVAPNGVNAVPSKVTAWLDARSPDDAALVTLVQTIAEHGQQRARRDGTQVLMTPESVSSGVRFDPVLARLLAQGGVLELDPTRLWPLVPTQAGHDAGVMAQAGVPTAMLFVRNPTGVSHSPAEHAESADCLVGVAALAAALMQLDGAAPGNSEGTS
jgi:beta-ureidopropionase / N-carbamoyl-L-amino-acid hydrolase